MPLVQGFRKTGNRIHTDAIKISGSETETPWHPRRNASNVEKMRNNVEMIGLMFLLASKQNIGHISPSSSNSEMSYSSTGLWNGVVG